MQFASNRCPHGASIRHPGTRVPRGTTSRGPYPGHVQILLWLVPPLVVTLVAMAWVSWASRDTAHQVDPEQAAARLEKALRTRPPVRYAPRRPPVSGGGSGVAVRPARDDDASSTRQAS